MAEAHRFEGKDLAERLSAIVGKTVAEVDSAHVLGAPGASRNKGIVGLVVERSVLGYPPDNEQRPDLVVDGEDVELKATGLVESSRGGWRAKECMSVTAVSPKRIVSESFSTSAFWHKARRLLIVYYLYVKPGAGVRVEVATFEFKGYDLHTWSEVDRARLEVDWTIVRDYVRRAMSDPAALMPGLSTLVNPSLLYLDTSPKYPHAPRFRLKSSLVTQIARERLDGNMRMVADDPALDSMASVRERLSSVAAANAGKTLAQLARELGVPVLSRTGKESKSLSEQVMVRLFTGRPGKASQVPLFMKAGLTLKTLALTATGRRTEDMKLNPCIDFDELTDPASDFDDSSFASLVSSRTLVVAVLSEQGSGRPLSSCRLLGFKLLWLGSYLDEARRLWDGMRSLVFEGRLVDVPVLARDGSPRLTPKTRVPMSAPNWPKSADGDLFVRGAGSDALEKPVEVAGVRMYRQHVWVKGTAIVRMLARQPFV